MAVSDVSTPQHSDAPDTVVPVSDVVGIDPLIQESRSRPSTTLGRREWTVSTLSAMSYLAAALAIPLLSTTAWSVSYRTLLLFVVAYAAASRVEFEIGTGSAVPTELVLVPMLFVLPPAVVPLAVLAGYLTGALVDLGLGQLRAQRLPVVLSTCWHVIGPATVLTLGGSQHPSWSRWPLYVMALLAQFVLDLVSSTVREWLGFGVSPVAVVRFLRPVFLVDALLAPVGLVAAFVIAPQPFALLAVLPLIAVFWLLARDRRSRIDQALALTDAYRGANREARLDALTGLVNRLGWDEAVASEQRRIASGRGSASVIVLDLDGLKAANDRHGHDVGDVLLRTLGEVLEAAVREHDVVARIGGDEFAILLPGGRDHDCARTVARITAAITRRQVNAMPLSASIGWATCPPSASLGEALTLADSRMYEAKRIRKSTSSAR